MSHFRSFSSNLLKYNALNIKLHPNAALLPDKLLAVPSISRWIVEFHAILL